MIGKILLTILLLPVCYGVGESFFEIITKLNVSYQIQKEWLYFLTGFAVYVVIQIIFFKPIRLYIFGHELIHAIAGIITGAKVKSFRVRKNTGSVELTKSNLFVTLAPYFIPVYTIILILLYQFICIFAKNHHSTIYLIFLFLLGASIAFHIALTIFAITQGQSDLKKYGVFPSLILVFISNCIFLSMLLSVFFQISFQDFVIDSVRSTQKAYHLIWTTTRNTIQKVKIFQRT